MCVAGRDAEKIVTVLSGGNGYMLAHRGEESVNTDGKRHKLETCDIHREGSFELIGQAEILKSADDKPVMLAFEIAATEILVVSRIARAI